MLGSHLRIGLAAAALATAPLLAVGSGARAQVSDGQEQAGREHPASRYDWRPPPPAVHGFWGQRRWQRYSDDFAARSVPASSHGDVRR